MLLIEKVTGQIRKVVKDGSAETTSWDRAEYSVTHELSGGPKNPTHTIRVFRPKPSSGPLAGDLVASFTISDKDAKELKAHL